MSERAWKFLGRGAVGPITRFAWPQPILDGAEPRAGAWVEAGGRPEPCRRGVHACRAGHLAHWLFEELWELELDGEIIESVDGVVAERGRLVRPVEAWVGALGSEMAREVAAHAEAAVEQVDLEARARVAAQLELCRQIAASGAVVGAAYVAAVVVARLGAPSEIEERYRRERGWQSAWLAERLG